MLKNVTFLYLFLVLVVYSNDGARIFAVFPAPSISHHFVFRPFTEELVRRGHEVIVITPDPAFPKGATPPNLTEIDVHDQSYNFWKENPKVRSKGYQDFGTPTACALDTFTKVVANYFENEEILNIVNDKNQKFDLLILEGMVKPALIFSHIYKGVPVIQINSFGGVFDNYNSMGAPTHPILYPIIHRRKINNLSFWDKISEIYNQYLYDRKVWKHEAIENEMFKKYFGDNAPDVRDLMKNIDMLFLNIHPLFEGIRPVPPSIVYIGRIAQKPDKELPSYLQRYLDSSKQGVIYVSFGTNAVPSLLPPERLGAIIKVFSELHYNVLWKYDKDELPVKSDNIRIGKWFPQSDILKHPNIKLFITQGGLQSTDEAINAGVPLVAVPIFADQWFNAQKYEYYKIGTRIDMETLTYDDFKNAINTVLGNESYRRNIINLRKLMQDETMKPLDRAVWWAEYVIRHGGAKHLRSPAANITWAEYLELELVITLLAGALFALTLLAFSLFFVVKRILKLFSPKTGSSKKKKN